MADVNAQLRLKDYPEGEVKDTDFDVTTEAVREPGPGEVLVRNHYVSADPSSRTYWNDGGNYHVMVKPGQIIT